MVVLVPIFGCLVIPQIRFEPLQGVVLAFLIYIVFAVGASKSIIRTLADDEFWVALTRKHGLRMAIVAGCFLLTKLVLIFLMYGLEYPPRIAFELWFDTRLPLGTILFTSAIMLGVLAGRVYTVTREPTEDQSPPHHLPGWLCNHAGVPKQIWSWLAIIGVLPTLITLIIVLEGYFGRGLFYQPADHSYIDSVEWMSEHEITLRLVGYYITDCVGCSHQHSVYTVDLATRKVELVESEYLDGPPKTQLFRSSIMSPDGTAIAYVADNYDLYVKHPNGGLFSSRRVFRYPDLGFVGRHYKELIFGLLISLLVGIVLVFPYFYANRKRPEIHRAFVTLIIWNLAMFTGSMMSNVFSPLNLHIYLWRPIP